ncbi:MAG: isoprenylcysteine carboxylmethyltransferase family protein [Anaerolineales bacterium]|nr:isoprenylcysteine carboxylmethyltransferase family protein [Anaerolineales bacterium]
MRLSETGSENQQGALSSEQKKGLLRWGVRETFGVVTVALLLFLPAQTVRWGWGWALVAVYAAWVTASAILLIPRSPDLLIERAQRRKDVKGWDTVLLSIIGLLTLGKYLVAGFDYRFGWTSISLPWQWLGLLLAIGGQALVTWGMVANAYFSMVVRMQEDRGQKVVTTGPYRFVRHPGYVGTILFAIGGALLLGSLWTLLPALVESGLFVLRTAWEDRDLQKELPGYREYAERVRWRLIPGIW